MANPSIDSAFSDSLILRIERDKIMSSRTPTCDSTFIYEQYAFNKYLFFPKKEQLVYGELSELKSLWENVKFQGVIVKLNDAIKRYNERVENYNTFYTTFPNSIFAKQKGLKRKLYFDMQYGIENKDPKAFIMERRKWQRKIEEQHGF